MIDPSELEGDDLLNWYRRSPAEVDAEREAARQEHYDAFVNGIGGAAAQDNSAEAPSPGDVDPSGGETGVVKARYFRPFAPPVMAPPSGLRVAPPLDARGVAPIGAPASGFFGQHTYLNTLGGYYTDLPSPLNIVHATPTGWWDIGDGRRVQSDEVERIYAEQNRRLKGQESVEPASRVRVVDKWQNGQIPLADQVEKGERELDPTCAPNGGWERDPGFDKYPELSKRYETQITRAPGLDYVVRNPGQRPVKFDGCAVWELQHPLLEAKGPGYASLLPKARQWDFEKEMFEMAQSQAGRQAGAAPNQPIEWHVAEPGAVEFFNRATQGLKPPILLRQTPPR
jgi:hypothetical protein